MRYHTRGECILSDDNFPLSDCHVLIIDDSELIQKSISRTLAVEHIRCTSALSGEEGLSLAQQEAFHLIFLDINLGDMNGVDVCEALRKIPGIETTPIVAISGSADIENHVNVLEQGADDFILKPFHSKVLLARVINHLKRIKVQQHNDELRSALQHYLSSPAVTQAQEQRAVEKLNAAILFSDMRGFTSASFDYKNEELFEAMNLALSFQADLVHLYDGYVDGFSGDGMLAVFSDEEAVQRAARAAIEIRNQAKTLSVGIWSPIPVGIGLHFGEVMRGDLGSENRKTFTVLGQTVNIAARLCGLARARDIIVSENMAQQLQPQFDLSSAKEVSIKGAPNDMNVFSLKHEKE